MMLFTLDNIAFCKYLTLIETQLEDYEMKYRVDFYYKGSKKRARFPIYTANMALALGATFNVTKLTYAKIVRL